MTEYEDWLDMEQLPVRFSQSHGTSFQNAINNVFDRLHKENSAYYWEGGWGNLWGEVLLLAQSVLEEE